MSDRVALMQLGQLVQEDAPRLLYENPTSRFAASFLGDMNVISGRVVSADPQGLVSVVTASGNSIRSRAVDLASTPGATVDVTIRPENVQFVGEQLYDKEQVNVLSGLMRKSTFVGDQVVAHVGIASADWQVRLRPLDPVPSEGNEVQLLLPVEACIAFVSDEPA